MTFPLRQNEEARDPIKQVLNIRSKTLFGKTMPRPKNFDQAVALDAAIRTFAENGYEGTSARMLCDAMGIGAQSLYNTFGGKWALYLTALRVYVRKSVGDQLAKLRAPDNAIEGLRAHLQAFAEDAARMPSCLGLSATSEFGCHSPEVDEVLASAQRILADALSRRISEAQAAGNVSVDLHSAEATRFLMATLSSIKLAARGGAPEGALQSIGEIALRALR